MLARGGRSRRGRAPSAIAATIRRQSFVAIPWIRTAMRNLTLQDSVNELMMLHAMGRFTDMEQRARVFLKSFAGAPILCEFLGLALAGQHRYNDALSYFQRAARGEPDDAQFWQNLASCQLQMGDVEEAERSLRRALTLEPGSAGTLTTLAGALYTLKRFEEARDAAERAVAIAPQNGPANFQLGRILVELSEFVPAVRYLRLALATGPNLASAHLAAVHNELGNALRQSGALTEAEASLRRAIELEPGNPVSYGNLALVCRDLYRYQDALDAAWIAFGILDRLGPTLSADHLKLLDVLAGVFERVDRSDLALPIYQRLFQINPDPLRALCATGNARRACDWEFAAAIEPLARRVAEEGTEIDEGAPWRLLSLASATAAEQLATARKCAQRVLGTRPPPIRRQPVRARTRTRIRVGYFSGDFCDHPIAHLISGVIEAHDHSRFEIIGYDFSPRARDEYRDRLERAFDRMVPVGELSNAAASQQIVDDDVDILIDICGWTMGCRPAVLVPHPAALQVQWLGFPGTLGAPWIDYIIADKVIIPASDETNFSEKIIRLPDTYQPSGDKRTVKSSLRRQDYGLPDDAVVFCSFNQVYKLTPEVFEVWLNLLEAVDQSVLWMREPQQAPAAALKNRLSARGLDPDRLIFAPNVAMLEHRTRSAAADLALDSFPYGSHSTAGDVLWAGVPLVGLMGDTFASRVSASVLMAAGLPELITRSLDDYQRLALRLASDREELARLKLRVQDQHRTAALFDTVRFTRNLEQAFSAIWERHMSGLPPDHVSV
jgi:protein O-GlcNAc transferase